MREFKIKKDGFYTYRNNLNVLAIFAYLVKFFSKILLCLKTREFLKAKKMSKVGRNFSLTFYVYN
jgi:hypothetical protein